jgi:hypothetical protein
MFAVNILQGHKLERMDETILTGDQYEFKCV